MVEHQSSNRNVVGLIPTKELIRNFSESPFVSMEENVSLQLIVYQSHGRRKTNLEEGLICLNQLPSTSLQTACQIRHFYVFFS